MGSVSVKEKEDIYESPVFEKQEMGRKWNESFPKNVVKEINDIILPGNACLQCSGCHGCR